MNEDVEYLYHEVSSAINEMRDMWTSLDKPAQQNVEKFLKGGTQLLNDLHQIWNKSSDQERQEICKVVEEFGDELLRLKEQIKSHTTKPSKH
jgi:hypothetical protein